MDCTPLSMRFSRQEYWSGLPFPSPLILGEILLLLLQRDFILMFEMRSPWEKKLLYWILAACKSNWKKSFRETLMINFHSFRRIDFNYLLKKIGPKYKSIGTCCRKARAFDCLKRDITLYGNHFQVTILCHIHSAYILGREGGLRC